MAKTINNSEIINFELSSGVKVSLDLSKNKAKMLTVARNLFKDDESGYKAIHYIVSNIATFDDKKLTVDEMDEVLSTFDMLELEALFGELRKKK